MDNPNKPQQNYDNGQFPTGTISFQVSKQVNPGDDISSTIKIINCFLGKLGKNYTLQKKSNTPSNILKQEVTVNEVMETTTFTLISEMDRVALSCETTDEEDLLSLFNQYSDQISPQLRLPSCRGCSHY